ncbi:hypothetical protein, partial [Roseobacter sp. HKCCA0434]|uniref:tetratricopeptide repeat protein n=1 Tax=Roseobacter sp. HKCCA0434 TaxID=3079297 RepID=UPI002905962A
RERASAGTAPAGVTRIAMLGVAALVVGGGLGTYALIGGNGRPDLPLAGREAPQMRPSQEVAERFVAAETPPPELSDRDAELLGRLREIIEERPTDLQGRRLLAQSYMQIGVFAEGRAIQQEVVELQSNPAGEDLAALGEFMVVAAGGYVSPEAEVVLGRAVEALPGDVWSAYYLARALAQQDRLAEAEAAFDELAARDLPQDLALAVSEDRSRLAIAAAPEAEQQARIADMVAGLAARLEAEGGTLEEWLRLIRAYEVQGQRGQADAARTAASAAFANAPDALARIGGAP